MKKKLFYLFLLIIVLISGWAYQKAKPLELTRDTMLPFPLDNKLREILYYAALAPNAHNTQPWQIIYNKPTNSFTLIFDRTRALPAIDPQNRESYLSLGAFLENFRQAAMAFGFQTQIDILPVRTDNDEIAHISLQPQGSPPLSSSLRLMERRHTDKRPYNNVAIPPVTVTQLIDNHSPGLHYYPRGSLEFSRLAAYAVEAAKIQALNQHKRDELALWLRFSNHEASQFKDGLPAEQLGMSGIKKLLYYSLYDRQKARGETFAQESIKKVESMASHSAGFFVLSGEETFSAIIRTGMNLEAFWLDAAHHGVSIQPVSQMLEEDEARKQIMIEFGLQQPAQMILRAGLLDDYGKNNKIRRNIAEFTQLSASSNSR